MPVEIKCKKCGHIIFAAKRANLLKIINDLVGTKCPACGNELRMPDPDKLQILAIGRPTRPIYQRKKVVSRGIP